MDGVNNKTAWDIYKNKKNNPIKNLKQESIVENVSLEVKSIKNFLPSDIFEKVKVEVLAKQLGPDGPHFYHTVAGRWLEEIHFSKEIEESILDIAKTTFNDNSVRRAGFHIARYQKQNGIIPQLWKHYDQSACQYSLDMCIDKNIDWQLVVDNVYYDEEPNSCVIFSGNDHMHWRPEFPTEDEDKYVTLLFMQFAKPDHWFFAEGVSEGFNNNSYKSDFKFRHEMGYWSQPDYSNNRPICACCDYRPILSLEEKYQEYISQNTFPSTP